MPPSKSRPPIAVSDRPTRERIVSRFTPEFQLLVFFCSWLGRDIKSPMADEGVVLRRSLSDFLRFEVDGAALDRLAWRDFGNGLSMSRLARAGRRELVLYRIVADAAADAFVKHEHLGGEFYLVLKGRISDETGDYDEGDIVFLDAHSVHSPRAVGETVVLVLWPEGVRLVDK